MRRLFLPILAVMLLGCHTQTAPPGYSGGDGLSRENAVVITGAKNEMAGVAAEGVWIEQRYPGFVQGKQALTGSGANHYDEIEITTREGDKTIYFDISEFFGK